MTSYFENSEQAEVALLRTPPTPGSWEALALETMRRNEAEIARLIAKIEDEIP